MANYHQVKNAAILTPTTNQDLGSDANRYSNVFMSGNIVMSNGVTVTSTNVITPKIASVTYPGDDTAADIAGGQTITITGTGFSSGASVLVGTTPSNVVTVVGSTSITFTSPALSAGNYALYVINSDGGTAIYIPGIAFSGTPTWSTSSGSLATVYETNSISSTVAATGDATISYSVNSGTLPTGSTLDTSTGLISGTAPASAGSTTYSFVIRATDGQNQDTDRSFTITVDTDSVSWSSPADNTSTALDEGAAMSAVTLSASSIAGKSITYTANALPTGVSISTNTIVGTPTVVGSTTSLITATAADSGRTATRTLSWVVSVASEPYWPYVTLLLNGEGAAASNNATNNTFIDSSTNAYTVTKTNTPTQGTNSPYSQASWSNYFDGDGDYLSIPYSTSISQTSPYTLEFWFYPTYNYSGQYIFAQNGGGAFGLNWTGTVMKVDKNGVGIQITGTTTMGLNQWHHYAMTYDGTTTRVFANGTLDGSVSSTGGLANVPTTIGYYAALGSSSYRGYISNFRFVSGTALYTSAFTPSTTPLTAIANTSLLTCQSTRMIDNSTTNATITRNGEVSPQKFSPFNGTTSYTPSIHGGSVYLKGANAVADQDFLTTTMTVLGTGDFTIECWTYLESTGFINGGAVWAIYNSGGTVQLLLRPENNVYWRVFYNNGTNINMTPSPVVTNRWTHHAVVRISGTTNYYQDGIFIGSGADTFDYGGVLKVGTYANYNMKGFISDFRVVAGTGVYTGSFTPPTQALTAISGTRVLLSFTNAGIIDQTGINDIITVGDGSSKISTSVKKFGNGSFSFGGTGGWIEPRQPNPILRLGTGDWTFEFWLRLPNITQSAIWLVNWNTDPRLQLTNATLSWMTAGAVRITTGNVLTADTWQHIAVVKYNGSTKIYVDGTQSGSTYADSNSYTVTNMDAIGYHPFVGYIDDFRITRGYARYTANFTAPTEPHKIK